MAIAVRPSRLSEISPLREHYRQEMNCQIIHDSIHARPGWTREYSLDLDGAPVGYGSLAVDGPWRDAPALYEFYVRPKYRMRMFALFENLLTACEPKIIETQSNAPMLTAMLHTFARNVRAGPNRSYSKTRSTLPSHPKALPFAPQKKRMPKSSSVRIWEKDHPG